MVDPNSFHSRFNIEVGPANAQARFIKRVHLVVYKEFLDRVTSYRGIPSVKGMNHLISVALGESSSIQADFGPVFAPGDDFQKNLQTIEVIREALASTSYSDIPGEFDATVESLLSMSECDLGIRWHEGRFYPAGAEELDEALVIDNLRWLRDPKYPTVRGPFEKGLDHLLHARSNPQLYQDVITDLYESLEALAKIVTGRDKELSGNRQLFIKNLKLSAGYSRILKEYIAFANDFRHAGNASQPRETANEREVEGFLYLTGLFIRLAIQPGESASPG